jgi:hypothetical protein
MRTIHLRRNAAGDWFVTVTSAPNTCHSHHAYPTCAQAHRAFVCEGRNQPYARMLVHTPESRKATVVRDSGLPGHDADDAVPLDAIIAVLKLPSPRRRKVHKVSQFVGTVRSNAGDLSIVESPDEDAPLVPATSVEQHLWRKN